MKWFMPASMQSCRIYAAPNPDRLLALHTGCLANGLANILSFLIGEAYFSLVGMVAHGGEDSVQQSKIGGVVSAHTADGQMQAKPETLGKGQIAFKGVGCKLTCLFAEVLHG